MSYGLKFTDRGLDDLKRMEFWLQEETLDELDRSASLLRISEIGTYRCVTSGLI